MYQKERLEMIMQILSKNGYVTVKYLTDQMHYSIATINRDLNILESQGLVIRSYGGVEAKNATSIPFVFRQHKMKKIKNKISTAVDAYVNDGDTLFIDGSTTTYFMAEGLALKKDLTVITNNMLLASHLCEYGVNVFCLGGKVVEVPGILYSEATVEAASHYRADKAFFSAGYFNENGEILSDSSLYSSLLKTILKNSKESFFLADSKKFDKDKKAHYCLGDFSMVNYVISDYEFSDKIKESFPDTSFILCV